MGLKDIGAYFQLGDKLKNARKASGWAQKNFAIALGVPASTYSNYENGNRIPPAAVLQKAAEVQKIPLHDLFSLNDPPAQAAVFHDWLLSCGYKVVLYEEEGERILSIKDNTTWDTYRLTYQELEAIQSKVAAFTRFQIVEFIGVKNT